MAVQTDTRTSNPLASTSQAVPRSLLKKWLIFSPPQQRENRVKLGQRNHQEPAMLGKRKPQYSFFDAIGLPHRVSPDSFYGRMGSLTGKLLRDEDLKEMYCADNGRPSLPPSIMAGAPVASIL
jgi:hypothetical protein